MASNPDSLALRIALAPITLSPTHSRATFENWGGTFRCRPSAVFEPISEDQCSLILQLARLEHQPVRAVASGHSPSDLPCTNGFMIRMDKMNKLLEVNREKQYVVVQGGMVLHDLHRHLARYNLAMSDVGSISDQSIAGIIATATHGSGAAYGCIPTQVIALDLLLADGTHTRCSRTEDPDLFLATCCGLGATALIISATLQVETAFRLEDIQEVVPFENVIDQVVEISKEAEHVRLWWFPQSNVVKISRANHTLKSPNSTTSYFWDTLVGHHLIQFLLFLGLFFPSINYYTGLFVVSLSSKRKSVVDHSPAIFNIDCLFPQYTTEWSIPVTEASATLHELKEWLDKEHKDPNGLRPHFPVEIRFSKADDISLSPAYGRDTCWIGIVQYKPYSRPVPYRALFHSFEQILLAHSGRPHWAKTHGFKPNELRDIYPRFDNFVEVLRRVDPEGLFRNEYVRRHVFGEKGEDVEGRVFKEKL